MITLAKDDVDRIRMSNVRRRKRSARRGYLYVAVLFTTLIVAAAVATAISLDTTRIKTQNAATDRDSAIRLAESELHRVAVQLASDPNWREDLSSGDDSDWLSYAALIGTANAAARYRVIDDDGDLADDDFDDIQVVAHARFGAAQAAVSVVLENGFAPLNLLRYGVTVFDDLECKDGSTLVSEKPVQVLDRCKSNAIGYITTSTLECSGQIETEIVVRGDIAVGDVQPPGFDVVSRYQDVGTEIPFVTLSTYSGARAIQLSVLSSSTNPYGPSDPNGIYWIDAQGQQINIVNSRIVATLAIRNASRVYLTGALSWEAPGDSGAILVTDAEVVLETLEPTLDEISLSANFNPPATPYRGGDSNLSLTDRFPTEFRGIVYTTDKLIVWPTADGDPVAITGAVIAYDLILHHSLFVRSYDEVLTDVPIGFVDPQLLRFKVGTFRRVETL